MPDHVGPEVISTWPWAAQFLTLLVLKDFLEWCVHVLLHRVHWLWQFHKLHHSIEELDWIGNFRFHFGEILVYRTLTFLPLLFLGAQPSVLLAAAVLTTLVSDLNHTNVNLSWGPLRYVLNSPHMHVWHHDLAKHGRHGQNYGIVFSTWDWIFGTAYWPTDREQPEQLGFKGMPRYPKGLLGRLAYPLDVRRWRKKP
jgi:sterol desaturase/sphingolipid hydroxylase (fatty acid hydroxylase superfamily)